MHPVEDDESSHASSDESDGETDFEGDTNLGVEIGSQYQSEFLFPSRPWLELSEALFQVSMMFWTRLAINSTIHSIPSILWKLKSRASIQSISFDTRIDCFNST
jgi:hypothetical protein